MRIIIIIQHVFDFREYPISTRGPFSPFPFPGKHGEIRAVGGIDMYKVITEVNTRKLQNSDRYNDYLHI